MKSMHTNRIFGKGWQGIYWNLLKERLLYVCSYMFVGVVMVFGDFLPFSFMKKALLFV